LQIFVNILLLLYYWLEGIVLFFIPKRLRFKDVSEDIVFISGGGSGLGRLLAIRFGKLGAKVIVWDLNQSGLEETCRLVKEVKGKAFSYICDVSDRYAVYEMANKVRQEVGKVTILINNAGIVSGKRFLETPDDKIIKTFEVNAISHFWTTKAFLPDMMATNKGHIVSIASVAGLSGSVRLSDYCASKFAAVGFEESLRLELQCDGYNGIHSTVVCPFFINTGMFAGVKSSIIPIMEPEFVADEIMAAVLTNQEVLIIPKMFYTLITLKTLLSRKASFRAHLLLTTHLSMSMFRGRGYHSISSNTSNAIKRSDYESDNSGRKL
jgi:all-trans-retinol dehydrogenase (NAD+)